jgi:hypothetical protein
LNTQNQNQNRRKETVVNLDSVFKDFDNADPSSVGGRLPKIACHGTFLVEINAVRFKESEQFDAVFLIVEFTVVESNTDKVKTGEAYGWVHDMTNKWFGAANTKQFIAAAAGLDPSSEEAKGLGRDVVVEAWSEDQPLAGRQVELRTSPKTTKSGYDIVVHDWSPVGG